MSAEQIYRINNCIESVEEAIDSLSDLGKTALCGAFFLAGTLLPCFLGW